MLIQSGSGLAMSFLFLYEAFTGSTSMKVASKNDSMMMARLLWHYYTDAHQPGSIWASLCSLLAAYPGIRAILPKFRDGRSNHNDPNLFGSPTDQHPVSPLDNLMQELLPVMVSLVGTDFMPSPPAWLITHLPPPSVEERRVMVVSTSDDDRSLRRPRVTDSLCRERELRSPDLNALLALDEGEEENGAQRRKDVFRRLFSALPQDIPCFAGQPLEAIGLSRWVGVCGSKEA